MQLGSGMICVNVSATASNELVALYRFAFIATAGIVFKRTSSTNHPPPIGAVLSSVEKRKRNWIAWPEYEERLILVLVNGLISPVKACLPPIRLPLPTPNDPLYLYSFILDPR